MDKQLRDRLKHDRFVEEVGHTFEYLSEHKAAVRKYGAIAGGALVIAAAVWGFLGWQRAARQDAYAKASAVLEATIGEGAGQFKTETEKQEAALKAFNEVAGKYAGSREGILAQVQAGSIYCDQGREADCEKVLRQAASGGDAEAASLGKLALATLYNAQGKPGQAETLLRELAAHPTAMVSKEQAEISLARTITASKRDEAKKILEGLQTSTRSAISRAAVTAMGELVASQK